MYDSVPILVEEPHVCPYVPTQKCSNLRFVLPSGSPEFMDLLLENGFRHFGADFFRPECPSCQLCEGIRVPVASFVPSRAQKRCWKANADLHWAVGPVVVDEERLELLNRFQASRSLSHDWDLHWYSPEQYRSSFAWVADVTYEITVRDSEGRLLGVGIVDITEKAVSGIYNYHDPRAAKRGLGTFMILAEIEEARKRGFAYYYLGLWNPDCASLLYKTRYSPHQILRQGEWTAAT